MAKKKKRTMVDELVPSFSLAGGAVGSGIIGGAFDSSLPAGMSNPLTSAGTTMSRFVSPVTTIGATTITLKQLKKLERRKK